MRTAARLFQQSCYRYREELSAGIIVAGWDPRRGGQVGFLQSWCPFFCPSLSPFSALLPSPLAALACFFSPWSVPSVSECPFLCFSVPFSVWECLTLPHVSFCLLVCPSLPHSTHLSPTGPPFCLITLSFPCSPLFLPHSPSFTQQHPIDPLCPAGVHGADGRAPPAPALRRGGLRQLLHLWIRGCHVPAWNEPLPVPRICRSWWVWGILEDLGGGGAVGRVLRGGLGLWESVWGHGGVWLALRGLHMSWEGISQTWQGLWVLWGEMRNMEGFGDLAKGFGGTEEFGQPWGVLECLGDLRT